MKNKIIKVILVFAITFTFTIFNNYNTQAIKDPLQNIDYYDEKINIDGDEQALEDMAGQILGIINTVGVVVSVIVLMTIGIKYMVGSVEEKAEYKKSISLYLIGAALLFAATTVPNILYNIGTSIGTEESTAMVELRTEAYSTELQRIGVLKD